MIKYKRPQTYLKLVEHTAIGAGRGKNAVSVMCSKIRLKRRGNKDIGSDR